MRQLDTSLKGSVAHRICRSSTFRPERVRCIQALLKNRCVARQSRGVRGAETLKQAVLIGEGVAVTPVDNGTFPRPDSRMGLSLLVNARLGTARDTFRSFGGLV